MITKTQTYAAMIDASQDVPDADQHSECNQCVRYDLDCDGIQHYSPSEPAPELTGAIIGGIYKEVM